MTAPTTDQTEAKPEAPEEVVDLTAFQNAANIVTLEEASDPKSNGAKHVRSAFTDLGRKGRKAAKDWISAQTRESVMANDTDKAKIFTQLGLTGVKPITGNGTAKTSSKLSEAERVLEIVKVLGLAYNLATARAADVATRDPEGMADWQTKVADITQVDVDAATAYVGHLEDEDADPESAPEASSVQKQAARVSLGKGPKGQGRKPKKKVTDATPAEVPASDPGAGPAPE